MVVSISYSDHLLLTWRVCDTQEIGRWKDSHNLTAVAKLDDTYIIVGDIDGRVIILEHENGASLRPIKKLTHAHS